MSSPLYLEYVDPRHAPEHDPADHKDADHDAHQATEPQEAGAEVRHGAVMEVAVPHLGGGDGAGFGGSIARCPSGVKLTFKC